MDDDAVVPGVPAQGSLDDGAVPTGLCLSGGGFRAMVFHLGAIVRLNQLGLLRRLDRVSSVSGGSITSALLGLRWRELTWDEDGVATNLEELVVRPIFDFAGCKVDVRCIALGLVTPGRSASDLVARRYDRHLYDGATLQDLPAPGEGPQFVIDATNVQTGHLFRFSRAHLADWSLGRWDGPTTALAGAVAASSSFPPLLSPYRLRPTGTYTNVLPPELEVARAAVHTSSPSAGGHAGSADATSTARPLYGTDFLQPVLLTDGGVYDNLGLQVVLPDDQLVLVSDAGAAFRAEADQPVDWVRHFLRASEIIESQVRALRKRELIGDLAGGARQGAYWGIRSDVHRYELADPLAFEPRSAVPPWHVATRLTRIPLDVRKDLVEWGYVIADTALRRWVRPDAPKPARSDIPV